MHSIHYRVYGNENAEKTALFLHGGPGAGCFPNHARFFDPKRWRVVLFDQRGCGSSTPKGCEVNNDTPHLVSDIEMLRAKIDDGKFGPLPAWDVVLGGSWGVTLALAYAQSYPERVKGMILRGVCTMRAKEVCWLFGPEGGARSLNPRGYSDFVADLSQEERHKCHTVLEAYRQRLFSPDPDVRSKAAGRWSGWESSMTSLSYSFSPLPASPITALGAVINRNADPLDLSARAASGLIFDTVTNSSVGSVNRSVSKALRGPGVDVVEWDGRRWLVDGFDEKQLQQEVPPNAPHPTPHTPHPAPCGLHAAPYDLHVTASNQRPSPRKRVQIWSQCFALPPSATKSRSRSFVQHRCISDLRVYPA